MKNRLFQFLVVVLIFLPGFTRAATEHIEQFDTTIVVHTDATLSVTEKIVYDAGDIAHHGILRDIYPYSAENKKLEISDITVTDTNGVPYLFTKSTKGNYIELKIGDPDRTFIGTKTYRISYTVRYAIGYFDSYDEVYWNTTGNNWSFPISHASASVILPPGATVLQSACYQGRTGSSVQCQKNSAPVFTADNLLPGEGLTVAVGFPKGIVVKDVNTTPTTNPIFIFLIALLLPLLTFIICFLRWHKLGRDPKGREVIVPEYDAPDKLTPAEVAIILYQKSRSKDISAELIYLATKGYLKIKQINTTALGVFNSRDYELTLLKDITTPLNEFDRKLLTSIFSDPVMGSTVALSTLRNSFYLKISSIFSSIGQSVLQKGYYKNLPSAKGKKSLIVKPFLILFVCGLVILFPRIFSDNATFHQFLLIIGAVVVSVIIFSIFQQLMPAKTEKGIVAKEYILGLKDYLEIAEKDRLKFHNAPEKKPEVFEKLLPYALVLGVEGSWAKEFKDLYTTPPSWYEGAYTGHFNAIILTNSLSSFSSYAVSSFVATPRGSGSGGGGFSGGGGGGGGGGSW